MNCSDEHFCKACHIQFGLSSDFIYSILEFSGCLFCECKRDDFFRFGSFLLQNMNYAT